eukprot:6194914-Pleurochrysis_carterae.AAC.1
MSHEKPTLCKLRFAVLAAWALRGGKDDTREWMLRDLTVWMLRDLTVWMLRKLRCCVRKRPSDMELQLRKENDSKKCQTHVSKRFYGCVQDTCDMQQPTLHMRYARHMQYVQDACQHIVTRIRHI